MKKTILLFACLLANVCSFGQKQQDIYTKTIDEINCKTTKTLLNSYNRAVAARSIQICTYDEILLGIGRVQENKLKGYKQKIAQLSAEIDKYKVKVSDKQSADSYSAAFEELNDMILGRFRKMCEQDQAVAPEVCPSLDSKILSLQGDLNDISDEALKQIKRHTVSEPAPAAPKPESEKPANSASDANTSTEQSDKSSGMGGITTTFIFLLIIALASVCGWLYKEVNDVKEQLEDLKTLVNILSKQKN